MTGTAFLSPMLPPELLDMVFELLVAATAGSGQHEKTVAQAGLAACALVCCAWRQAVLPHLFKDFKCTMHVEFPYIPRIHGGIRKLDSLIGFLESSPRIRNSIRSIHLNLSFVKHTNQSLDRYFGPREPDSCPVRLMKILQILPRLEHVHFSNVCPHLLISPAAFAQLGALPAVTKLDTLRIDFDNRTNHATSVYKINTLLSFFREVRYVQIQHAEIVEERDYYPELFGMKYEDLLAYRTYAKIPRYCKFETIHLHDVRNASTLLSALGELPAVGDVKSLKLGCMFAGGSCGLTALMRAVHKNLEHLELRAECTPSVNALDLSVCQALSSLEIVLPMHTPSGRLAEAKVPYMVLNNLPRFLLSAPRTLRSVTFRLRNAEGWVSQFMADLEVTMCGIGDALIDLVDNRNLSMVIVECDKAFKVIAESKKQVMDLVQPLQERGALHIVDSGFTYLSIS